MTKSKLKKRDHLYNRAVVLLESGLGDADFIALGELIDGDPTSGLLDAINERLSVSHPELFISSEVHEKLNEREEDDAK